jgi:hypothetical protein
MSQDKLSRRDVEEIVSRLSFMDRKFRLLDKGEGWLLQMQYMEPDVDKPGSEPVLQSTRKWYVSPFMTESEVVETAWACVTRSQMHVASEHFTYKGRKVYSQHFDVQARIDMCDKYDFDGREPISAPVQKPEPDCWLCQGLCRRDHD